MNVRISHERLAANPYGPAFTRAVKASAVGDDGEFATITRVELERLVEEHSASGDVTICLRTLGREALGRKEGFYEACLRAGKVASSELAIPRSALRAIRAAFPQA